MAEVELWVHSQRNDHVRRLSDGNPKKAPGFYTYDCDRMSIHIDALPQHRGISSKSPLPIAITDHRDRLFVRGRECAAYNGLDAQD